jgi:hypothetical protein
LLGMNHFCSIFAFVLLLGAAVPAWADGRPLGADDVAAWREQDCGGDAFSYAEVVSRPAGEREAGPVVVVPDAFCADLARQTPAMSLNIHVEAARPQPPAARKPQPRP